MNETAGLNARLPDDIESTSYDATLSYASPHDSSLVQLMIRGVERLAGTRRLQRLYNELCAENHPPAEVWGAALRKLRIQVDYDAEILESVPDVGPLVFVANHPFGVLDGLILCHLVSRVRNDLFLLVNESVLPQPLVEGHLLPIDFHPSKDAIRTNLNTKRRTTERLRHGASLAIFPAGMVATASKPFGLAVEQPWHTFVSRRIHEAQCTVVPLYFHGQNSRLFQLASQFSTHVRLGLLMHEVTNKIGTRIRVEIGQPIPYQDLQPYRNAQQMVDFLRRETLGLADQRRNNRRLPNTIEPLSKRKSRIRGQASGADLSVSP